VLRVFTYIPKQMENTFCWKVHYRDAPGLRVVGRGLFYEY